MKLSEHTLRQLIANGETNTVEFKIASPRPIEMAERLCGMANAQGGFVIIGIEDATLRIVGIPNERLALTKDVVMRAARQFIQPILILDPPEPEVYILDGQQIVVATVPANRGLVYQASGVFWVRRGTHTVPLNVSEMLELANDRGLVQWELQPARRATMDDIDVERVKAYLERRPMRAGHGSRLGDIEKVLFAIGCATINKDGEIVPTNAGILFFGYEPQQFIVQSDVVCVLFGDKLGIGGYTDRKNIVGTIQELIDGAEDFLNKYVAIGAKIQGWKRIDLPEYPIEALREAVVNAVIHRDYSRSGESIRVFYYTDRIEVHSPGLLLPGITIEQMERGEVISKLRNPTLANLLKEIPGYMERLGSGIRFMINETKRMELPPPQFREQGEFVVTFRNNPSLLKEQSKEHLPNQGQLWDIPTSGYVNERKGVLDQKRRMALAMRYVQEHGTIFNRDYRELTGVSEQTALRDLEMLVDQGILKRIGKTRSRQYKLP